MIRRAESLGELCNGLGVDSVHEAYFRAKQIWRSAVEREQNERNQPSDPERLPGARVGVNDVTFYVHGVTHADTDQEREFLRMHVANYLDPNTSVYCEQGIRPMYFQDFDRVCAMDDYRWAMDQCASLDTESRVEPLSDRGIEALLEDVSEVASTFRQATFSLVDSGSSVYGDRFESALGDIAAAFVTDHTDLATGKSYEAFRLSKEASRNPEKLEALQRYYERAFLPQPLEREWLRRHDPELEIVSHARNERMADYVVYHNEDATDVHLIVGAAHQPGVEYYLNRYNEGRELPKRFELF